MGRRRDLGALPAPAAPVGRGALGRARARGGRSARPRSAPGRHPAERWARVAGALPGAGCAPPGGDGRPVVARRRGRGAVGRVEADPRGRGEGRDGARARMVDRPERGRSLRAGASRRRLRVGALPRRGPGERRGALPSGRPPVAVAELAAADAPAEPARPTDARAERAEQPADLEAPERRGMITWSNLDGGSA